MMDSKTAYYTLMYLYYAKQHDAFMGRFEDLYYMLSDEQQQLWNSHPVFYRTGPAQRQRFLKEASDWLGSTGRIAHAQQMEEALYEE
jgi:hypothetical protein